jgi:cytochrome subunit of sulfide dehydrogenase
MGYTVILLAVIDYLAEFVFIFVLLLVFTRTFQIMIKKCYEFKLSFCATLFSLCLASNVFAVDVNKTVEACAGCHGAGGASTDPVVPIIGGYSVEFLSNNLKAYKNKERVCPDNIFKTGSKKGIKTNMCLELDAVNYDDLTLVAEYFAQQPFVRAKQKFDPELAKKGKLIHDDYCESCHTQGGTVASDDYGIIGGQWMFYIKESFDEFNADMRPIAKKMKDRMVKLSKEDLDALINYYGSIQ